MPAISLFRPSLAINPAGSSAPLMIRSPVLSRCSVLFSALRELASPFWANNDATFVLIRAIQSSVIAHGGPSTITRRAMEDPDPWGPWKQKLLLLFLTRTFRNDLSKTRKILGFYLRRRPVFPADGFIHFLAMDSHFLRGLNPQTNLVTADIHHSDLDVVSDHDRLISLTRQHQH